MPQSCNPIVHTLGPGEFCDAGYARSVPFGCVDQGLLSLLYFLPEQSMAPHRHLDSDEYFTTISGEAEMLVNGALVPLPLGHTFLRRRGTLHAIRNVTSEPLVIQSFQVPIPQAEEIEWERVAYWPRTGTGCRRCWCGQIETGNCANCGAASRRLGREAS